LYIFYFKTFLCQPHKEKLQKKSLRWGNDLIKHTQSPLGVYKLASYGLLRQCKPFYPALLACFITNHFPMRGFTKPDG
jgi:hypothetical protein